MAPHPSIIFKMPPIVDLNHPVRKALRPFFALFGILCVGVGFVGLVTPGLPGFVFFLIALWSFRNSSPKLETWLLNNRFVGPTLRDWEEHKSLKMSTKIIAISSIWIAIGFTIYGIAIKPPLKIPGWNLIVPKPLPIGVLMLTIALLTWYLASRKTKSQ